MPRDGIHTIISTGASVAIPTLLYFALTSRKRLIFIELMTRIHRPSVSGRVLAFLPRVELHSPHPNLGQRWNYLDPNLNFKVEKIASTVGLEKKLKVLVMAGTTGIPMNRFCRVVSNLLRDGDEVIVQGDFSPKNGTVFRKQEFFTVEEIDEFIRWADVVVTHSGVGSVLDCLEAGRKPVVIPRLSRHGEHVDDHQLEFTNWLVESGLAVDASSDGFNRLSLFEAASERVVQA